MMILILTIFILLASSIVGWLKSENKKRREELAFFIVGISVVSAFIGLLITLTVASLSSIPGKEFAMVYLKMAGLSMIIMGIAGHFLAFDPDFRLPINRIKNNI